MSVPLLMSRLGIRAQRRRGRNGTEWWARCPLPDHEDSTPSWSIVDGPSQDTHAYWRCFGCSRGGGPVALVQALRGLDSEGAREWLAGCAAPEAGEWRAPVVEVAARIPGRLRWPPEGAEVDPRRWPDGALRYWVEARGLPLDLAREHGVAATSARGRCPWSVVVPVVAFGALRTWVARRYVPGGRRHDQARRDEGAQPDLALWGEPHLDPSLPALACEGVFDALSLAACGLRNAVAVLGVSAVTPAKLAALARCPAVVACYDADEAGDRAALELERALGRHREVVRARPPEGSDWGSAPVRAVAEVVGGVVEEWRRRCR